MGTGEVKEDMKGIGVGMRADMRPPEETQEKGGGLFQVSRKNSVDFFPLGRALDSFMIQGSVETNDGAPTAKTVPVKAGYTTGGS